MADTTICLPRRLLNSMAARMDQLSPSVPQEVKYSSSAAQPSRWATTARSSASRAAAARPAA